MKSLLSATLKNLRKEYGLTQEDLALKCGVGLNFVRQLEQVSESVLQNRRQLRVLLS